MKVMAMQEMLRRIRENLPTQPKWTRADYVDFYQRDVEFLLPLAEAWVRQLVADAKPKKRKP